MSQTIGGVPVSFFTPGALDSLAAIGRTYRTLADIMPVDYRDIDSLGDAADSCQMARDLEGLVVRSR